MPQDPPIAGALHTLVYFNSAYIIEALSTGSTENCLLLACYVRNVLIFLTCLLGLKILVTPLLRHPTSFLNTPFHLPLPLSLLPPSSPPPIITPSPPPLPFFRDCSLHYSFPDASLPLVGACNEGTEWDKLFSPSKQK